VPDLAPEDMRAFAARAWQRVERLSAQERARRPVAEKLRIAEVLRRAAAEARPGWPDTAARLADLDHHRLVRHLLRAASDVGAR